MKLCVPVCRCVPVSAGAQKTGITAGVIGGYDPPDTVPGAELGSSGRAYARFTVAPSPHLQESMSYCSGVYFLFSLVFCMQGLAMQPWLVWTLLCSTE